MLKNLYLSDDNKKIGGVCGGIGEYFNIDPTLIRLLVVILTIVSLGFGGVIAYLVAWALIPRKTGF